MKQRNTGSREHGLVRSVCYLMMRVLRANIKVVSARSVRLDLYYEYRDANVKPSEYTSVLAKEMGAHLFRPGH